jgi:NAD+ synthase
MEAPSSSQEILTLNSQYVRTILVGFLRDEAQRAGFQAGVLGLSGGVDSALVAYLAVEALGRDNLLGVLMPYKTSNPQSTEDGELVAQELGIRTEVVDITPMVDPLLKPGGSKDRVRAGNIMARVRMIVLYDLSAREKALVIGTSNKTEILLGYGTLFGDLACALNPLGDLYKTQVWDLARALGVPQRIIEKPPSADLWEGQSDEDELGLKYREVDRLLYWMVDEHRSEEEVVSLGFNKAMVESVSERVRKNQFKRRPPLVAKVSHRTMNVDFRYARDWGI